MNYFARITHDEVTASVSKFVETLRSNKLVHFVDVPADTDFKQYYRELASAAGSFVKRDENFRTGDQSEAQEEWMDIRFVDEMKSQTFRHSDTRQPIHTDGAYTSYHFDISFFFCTVQAEYGGATTFIDGKSLIQLMRKHAPDLLRELEETEVIFDKGEQQKKSQKVIRYDSVGPLLNWNHFRISADNSASVRNMCDYFFEFTERRIFETGLLMPLTLQPGEAVLFHDERVLHGRNAFIGDRCLIKGGINL